MSTYRVEIETNNAAFDPAPDDEVTRILRHLIERIERDDLASEKVLRDINGNSVGRAWLEVDE
jgi:hypothetical protein